ncbi:MAG: hypothetical protein AB7Q97_13655 [Gammaproteobacteria bacterium]
MKLPRLGPQRAALITLTVVLIATGPFSNPRGGHEGWHLMVHVLAPVFATILMFVLPLDMTMSRIFMVDPGRPDQDRYRAILRLETGLFALLVATWLPFAWRLLSPGPS